MVSTSGGYVVADSVGNTLLNVSASGSTTTLAVLPSTPVDVVPTSVTRAPEGAEYVSELTGFPFAPGAAHIWRVVPGQQPTGNAAGLTNVTDLAWHNGSLYAVQLVDEGLLSGSTGSLVKVLPVGGLQTVVDDLVFPDGVAFQGNRAYLTVGIILPGGGAVISVPVS